MKLKFYFALVVFAVGLLMLTIPMAHSQPGGPIRPNYHWIFVDNDPPTSQACTTTQEIQAWFSIASGRIFTCQNGVISTFAASGLPANNPAFTGILSGPTTTSSVNTQINVMAAPYNAKGDGVTDDQTSINAACTAAKVYSPPAAIYLPKPPIRYLTSTLTQCAGLSFIGQPPGVGIAVGGGGVVVRGKPGQDILNFHDPNTNTLAANRNWRMEHIQWQLDDSIDASSSGTNAFPHRWPGRWTQDGAMTSGSAVLTAPKQIFSCADVGVGIVVKGAGAAGADLNTTIVSLPNCWKAQQTTATLAAAASTTVSGALVYTSIPGVSATQTLGNCAIAGDNFDGNPAHWLVTFSNSYPSISDVSFITTSGANQNNSCAIYWQGQWQPYGFKADHMNIQRYVWGIVEAGADTNPGLGSSGQDFQEYHHMLLQVDHPWVTYNGSDFVISGVQLQSIYGPYIGQYASSVEGNANFWDIDIGEFEVNTSGFGMILKGYGHTLHNAVLSGVGSKAYWEADTSYCYSCSTGGSLQIDDGNNRLDFTSNVDSIIGGGLVNNGFGNIITGTRLPNPFKGRLPSRQVDLNSQLVNPGGQSRGNGLVGYQSTDFLLSGNATNPYLNQTDLLFFPQDFEFSTGTPPPIITDTASFSGRYIQYTASTGLSGFDIFNLNVNPGSLIIGTQVPAGKVNIYDTAKCPTLTSYFFQVFANGVLISNSTFSCTTTYSLNSALVDLSTYSGQVLTVTWAFAPGEVDESWMAIVPFTKSINNIPLPTANFGPQFTTGPSSTVTDHIATFLNANGAIKDSGKPFAGAGAGVTTGPVSGTVAGHIATFNTSAGQIADSGVTPISSASTGSIGGGVLTAGQCATGTASITGAVTTGAAFTSPVTYPGDGFTWGAYISAADTITVKVCAIAAGTPTASIYQVRYQP